MFIGNDKQLSKIPEIRNIEIDKHEFKRVNKAKYLGPTIHESLSWNQKTKVLKGKLKGRLNSIRKLREIHKILKEMCPENLKGKFTRRTKISKYETRRINDLQIPKPRLEISKKSFSYAGAKVWRDILNDIRNVEFTHLFKHTMKTCLLGQ